MPLVFRLPPKEYQFLALQTAVYWALVIGHAAAGFGLLIGLPLLPLVVIQIALLFHVWATITGGVSSQPDNSPRSAPIRITKTATATTATINTARTQPTLSDIKQQQQLPSVIETQGDSNIVALSGDTSGAINRSKQSLDKNAFINSELNYPSEEDGYAVLRHQATGPAFTISNQAPASDSPGSTAFNVVSVL